MKDKQETIAQAEAESDFISDLREQVDKLQHNLPIPESGS